MRVLLLISLAGLLACGEPTDSTPVVIDGPPPAAKRKGGGDPLETARKAWSWDDSKGAKRDFEPDHVDCQKTLRRGLVAFLVYGRCMSKLGWILQSPEPVEAR